MNSKKLSDGVASLAVRTPTLPPATHTNSYALGTREVVLVEPSTPYEDEQRAWLEWARSLSSAGRTPIAIVATHHHPDHIGGARALSEALNLPLWAHEATISRMPGGDFRTRSLVDGEVFTLAGPTPSRWEVLHTPGHAPGHVCLFDRDSGALVVGDMVASVGTILIAPGDGHMGTYLKQLERLEGLPATVALPAHGAPIENPSALFRYYREHRKKREARIIQAFSAAHAEAPAALGSFTADQLLPFAYADAPRAIWPIALLSLRTHLEKLVEDGLVSESADAFRLLDRPPATV